MSPPADSPDTAPSTLRPGALHALARMAAVLASDDDLDALLARAVGIVAEMVGAGECSVWLADDDGELRLAAATGGWLSRLPPRVPGSAGRAADRATDVPAGGDTGTPAMPLILGGERLGVLGIVASAPLDPAQTALFGAAADLLAPIVGHARRRVELERELADRQRQADDDRRLTERIIDALPIGLYVIDREFRIGVWNRKRETGLQGISREEAVGRTIFEILHRQPAEMLRQEFDDVFRTGVVQHFSMESNSTGELRYYRISKIPMRDNLGNVTHVITLGEDVTESREAQERFAQAEKLAAIGQLAAGVMHEINNPLATIAACAESLALALGDARHDGASIPAEAGDYLRIVESEVQRCKRIVDRLLEFSRPRPLTPEPVDINAVVEQTLFLLKHHTRFKRFTVRVDLAATPPVTLGNAEQLVQVLMALLINAMDATEGHDNTEQGTIDVSTRSTAGPPAQAVIEVRDHGHGIPRSQLAKIFEPFYTTKAPGRGTGLGLSICYGIVAEHGGRIEVESGDGEGTVFSIVLPSGDAA